LKSPTTSSGPSIAFAAAAAAANSSRWRSMGNGQSMCVVISENDVPLLSVKLTMMCAVRCVPKASSGHSPAAISCVNGNFE
jgi:hypothetical protein